MKPILLMILLIGLVGCTVQMSSVDRRLDRVDAALESKADAAKVESTFRAQQGVINNQGQAIVDLQGRVSKLEPTPAPTPKP